MKIKLSILIWVNSIVCYSQSFDIQCSSTPYLSFEAGSFKTHKYEPVYKATKIYTTLSEVKNEFPEQLIESEMSVTSQEWSSFNYGKPRDAEPNRYESIKNLDIEKNYWL